MTTPKLELTPQSINGRKKMTDSVHIADVKNNRTNIPFGAPQPPWMYKDLADTKMTRSRYAHHRQIGGNLMLHGIPRASHIQQRSPDAEPLPMPNLPGGNQIYFPEIPPYGNSRWHDRGQPMGRGGTHANLALRGVRSHGKEPRPILTPYDHQRAAAEMNANGRFEHIHWQ